MTVYYHEFFNYFNNLKIIIEQYVENKNELCSNYLHDAYLNQGNKINKEILEFIKNDLDYIQRTYLLEELVPMYMNHDCYDYCNKNIDYYIQNFILQYIKLIRNINVSY